MEGVVCFFNRNMHNRVVDLYIKRRKTMLYMYQGAPTQTECLYSLRNNQSTKLLSPAEQSEKHREHDKTDFDVSAPGLDTATYIHGSSFGTWETALHCTRQQESDRVETA
jgi:hypothetical protein